MKTMTLALAGMVATGLAGTAEARGRHTYRERHCGACIRVYESHRMERRPVTRCEQVLVGYRDEVVRHEEVWVERNVTVYETRTVYRTVLVGHDACGRPIYRRQAVCERVPVCRTERVCERRPVCEKRPVYETRQVTTSEWVRVPQELYLCVR